MIPGPFEYHQPGTVEEAVALLGQYGDTGQLIAGGHSLIPMMKLRLAVPDHLIDLRLHFFTGHRWVVEDRADLDFRIEMADVAEDRLILHRIHMLAPHHIAATGGSDEDIAERRHFFHSHNLVTFHRGLQCADRIDLGDEHSGALAAQA